MTVRTSETTITMQEEPWDSAYVLAQDIGEYSSSEPLLSALLPEMVFWTYGARYMDLVFWTYGARYVLGFQKRAQFA